MLYYSIMSYNQFQRSVHLVNVDGATYQSTRRLLSLPTLGTSDRSFFHSPEPWPGLRTFKHEPNLSLFVFHFLSSVSSSVPQIFLKRLLLDILIFTQTH